MIYNLLVKRSDGKVINLDSYGVIAGNETSRECDAEALKMLSKRLKRTSKSILAEKDPA